MSLLETMRDWYLTHYINEHTRVTQLTQPSLLDLLLTDVTLIRCSIQYSISLGKSNLVLIKSVFAISVDEEKNKDRPNFKNARYVEMQESITNDWSDVRNQNDAKIGWCLFKAKLLTRFKRPGRMIKVNGSKCWPPPNPEILSLLKSKKWMWENCLNDKSTDRSKMYTQIRNELRSISAAAILHDIEVSLEAVKNPKISEPHIEELRSKEATASLQKTDGTLTYSKRQRKSGNAIRFLCISFQN